MQPRLFTLSTTVERPLETAAEFCQTFPDIHALYKRAEAYFGFDLLEPQTDIEHATAQAYLPTMNTLAAWQVIPAELRQGAFLAGYSLDEYLTFIASGMLGFDEGLDLIRERDRAIDRAHDQDVGARVLLTQIDRDTLHNVLIKDYKHLVWIASVIDSTTFLLSGDAHSIQQLCDRFVAHVVEPPQPEALHTVLMKDAAIAISEFVQLGHVNLVVPTHPILTNVDAALLPAMSNASLADYLATQITSPARWRDILRATSGLGIRAIIHLGPSPSSPTPVPATTITDPRTLEAWIARQQDERQ